MASTNSTKVAVIGASGYAGEELVRLLLAHPLADLAAVTSRQFVGKTLEEVFPRFSHHQKARELRFTESEPAALSRMARVVFLALPHGVSAKEAQLFLDRGARVIDLSADFRLRHPDVYEEFYGSAHPSPDLLGQSVYGLPEIYRDRIGGANLVACPGCYPTSILIPLLPLVQKSMLVSDDIVVTSLSGVTGAGRKIEADYLFAECNESIRPYGVPKHRHLSEVEQELSAAAGAKIVIQFVPHLVPTNRGIVSTISVRLASGAGENAIADALNRAYGDEPFVRLLGTNRLPDTKNVIGTNFVDIAWKFDQRTGRLILMSAIDNLVKGTSGQAIQCFNLMCGYSETAGLM